MECFTILANGVKNRIDPHFYRPTFIQFYQKLKRTKLELKNIGEIAERVTSGATPLSTGNAYVSKEEGIAFIRSGDLNEDKNINFDETLYIRENTHNKLLKGSKLKRGDVLIAIVGATIGQVSIYDYDKEANINQAIALVRLKPGINPEYVKAYLVSVLGQKQLDRIKRPVARANINLDEIRGINIILPSVVIQNKIVTLMENSYKEEKNKNREISQFLESINDYVLDELGIKLPELKSKTAFAINSSNLRDDRIDVDYYQPKFKEIEKIINKSKYKIIELKELVEIRKGIEVGSEQYVEDGVPFVRVADIDDYNISLHDTDKKISSKLYESLKDQFNPKKDEILYSKDGTIGFSVLLEKEDDFIISGGILRLIPKININNYYLKIMLSNRIFKIMAERKSIGAIIKHLLPEELLKIKIPLPPLPIQNKIAEEVKKRIKTAQQLQKEAKDGLEKAKQEVEKMILGE